MLIMSVALDGRNEAGCDDSALKQFAIAIRDDFSPEQKYELMGARNSGMTERDGPKHFNDKKLKRFLKSGKCE